MKPFTMKHTLTLITALLLTPLAALHAAETKEVAAPSGIAASTGLVSEGKLVLAHYMTKMVPGVAGERDWAQDGPMRVRLLREDDGTANIDFTTPVGITRSPLRIDRLTYSYSSNFDAEFRSLFGDVKPISP